MTTPLAALLTPDEEAALYRRHGRVHSCFGMDPILGAGYRNFGMEHDGVLCDAMVLAGLLDALREDALARMRLMIMRHHEGPDDVQTCDVCRGALA